MVGVCVNRRGMECDYYLLIIGARYGSTDSAGVSFTEREFDYAVSKGKTVIALLHNDIQNLPKKKFDDDPALELKVHAFREKVRSGRMVRFWNNRDQISCSNDAGNYQSNFQLSCYRLD